MSRVIFVAVLSFAAGVALMDTLHEPERVSCQKLQASATRLATAVAHVLNGGGIETKDVRASCTVTPREES